MKTKVRYRLWAVLTVFIAATVGCGKPDSPEAAARPAVPPRAMTTQAGSMSADRGYRNIAEQMQRQAEQGKK